MSSRGLLRLEHELVLRSTFLAQRYDTLRLRERFTLLSCQVASDLVPHQATFARVTIRRSRSS